MAATIASETFASLTKKGSKIQNAQIGRAFALGTWTKIRIGIMGWVSAEVTTPSNGAVLYFGLNSGTVNMPGDASCSHFVGLRTVGATGAKDSVWSGGATDVNTTTRFFLSSNIRAVSKLVGTTYTALTTSNISSTTLLIGPCNLAPTKFKQTVLYIDYTRVSATEMTVGVWLPSNNFLSGTYVWTTDDFLRVMETSDPNGVSINASTAWFSALVSGSTLITNGAVNEGVDGTLNAVVFGWDRSLPYFVVNDIAVIRLA